MDHSPVAATNTQATWRYPALKAIDRLIGWASEVPAALLVAVEIIILLSGVIARYGLNAPLTWSDELASILFLWLAMLGAVIALRRSEHMCLTMLVNRVSQPIRQYITLGAQLVVTAFVLEIILPAYDYFQDQWLITTPALEIPDGLRVAAIGVGALMMLALTVIRLLDQVPLRRLLGAVVLIALVCGGLWLAQPWFLALGNVNLLIFFVGAPLLRGRV